MKIKILYSHYNTSINNLKARPKWFDYEKCFNNFSYTIGGEEDIELHVIYDITRGGVQQNWIKDFTNCVIHEIRGGSMFGAAKEMYRIAKELSENMEDDDLFYFMENDYLHLNGSSFLNLSSKNSLGNLLFVQSIK